MRVLDRNGAAPDIRSAVAPVGVGLVLLTALSPKLAIGAVAGLVFVAVCYASLAGGVAMFTVLSFFDRVPGSEGAAAGVTKAAGAVLAAAWLLRLLDRRRPPAPVLSEHPAFALTLLLLAAWSLASTLWATSVPAAIGSSTRVLESVLFLLLTWSAIQTRRHVWWVLSAFVAGATLTAIPGFLSSDSERFAGDFGDPNELAAVLVPALVIAGSILLLRTGRARWLVLMCMPILALALLYTDSQGGLLAAIVGGSAAFLLAGPARVPVRAAIVVAAVLVSGYYVFVTPPVALQEVLAGGGGAGREDLWKVAVQMAKDHPVIGVGAGNFTVVEPGYALADLDLPRVDLVTKPEVTHNSYLQVLAELGAVGLALFAGVIGGSMLLLRGAISTYAWLGERELEMLARVVMVCLLSLLVAYFFLTAQYEKQLWLLLGVAAALASMARREAREVRAAGSGRAHAGAGAVVL